MNTKPFWTGLAALVAAGLCVAAATVAVPAQDIAPPPGGDAAEGGQDYDTLTRGPLHEAFANPYGTNPDPGVIVAQRPPDPIDEVPPEQMPEGDNVAWIPGYWGWDPDGEEFLWISGLWRNVPADRRWVPGYWAEVNEGWQWVAGFWTSAQTEQLAYLPEPPPSLEQGPNIAPPDGDYFWMPGCWIWQDANYDWRPGYWAQAVADWIWVPDQYVWTPYGCVFVPGYWDYAFVDRGVIFAPVMFHQAVYSQPGYQYTPSVVIDSAPLLMHLFVSPTYSHYFYGDYYAFQPQPQFGFQPWVTYARRPSLYDPLLTYYQWSYGQRNVNIVQRLTVWNQYFVRNGNYRPPRTFRQQRQFLAQANQADLPLQATSLAFATPLQEFAQTQTRADRVHFEPVAEPARKRFAEAAQAQRQFQAKRSEFEVSAASQTPPAQEAQPGRPPAEQALPTQTLALPEATAVAPTTRSDAKPARDAAPGRDAAGDGAASGRTARPEPPPPPQPGQTAPSADETGDPPAAGRPRAGDRPDRTRTGEDAANENPTADEPAADRRGPRDERPGRSNRPNADAPGLPPGDTPNAPTGEPDAPTADDAAPDTSGPTLPDGGNPGHRPGRDARSPGRDRPERETATPGVNEPNLDRPDGTPPGTSAADADQEPRFPRFGTGRNRGPQAGPAPEPDGPTAGPPGGENDPSARPGLGRRAGGFDPFGGLPPGINEDGAAPDASGAFPRAGRRPGPRGALTPDAADPTGQNPPAGRPPRGRGRSALPGGGQGGGGGLIPGPPPGGPPALNGPRRNRGVPNAGAAGPGGGAPGNQPATPSGPAAGPQASPGGPPPTPPATPPAQGGGNGGGGPKPKKEKDKKGGPGG